MRRFLVLLVLGLTACGSSGTSSGTSAGTSAPTAPKPVLTVGAEPSESSKMICGEAKGDIADSLGVSPTQVTEPTWIDDTYSCTYVYPDGSFTLSVKELNGIARAATYFAGLKTSIGVKPGSTAPDLGQAAFVSPGGGLVVQKDNKVLTIDVSHLPAEFGPQHQKPDDVAVDVGGVIMGCWTGA